MSEHFRRIFLPVAIVTPLLLPAVVYAGVAISKGLSVSATASALAAQAVGGRPNLFAPAILSVLPVSIIFGLHWLARKRDPINAWRHRAAWTGLGMVLCVLLWANLSAWPLYMPGRQYPGFPHGLELIIGPLFFAPVAALVGWFMGAFIGSTK